MLLQIQPLGLPLFVIIPPLLPNLDESFASLLTCSSRAFLQSEGTTRNLKWRAIQMGFMGLLWPFHYAVAANGSGGTNILEQDR